MRTYYDLASRLHEIATLNSIGALVGWDEQTMMPPAATAYRAEQAALLARLSHERLTAPDTHDLLAEVEAADLDDDQRVVVRELRRDLDRATRLPGTLVVELSRATVLSQAAWGEARAAKDFAAFSPWLERIVALKRDEAACYGSASGDPYDALLDTYEPGETVATLRPLFDSLVPQLVRLLDAVRASGRRPPKHLVGREIPVEAQKRVIAQIARDLGFDTAAGRLDTSLHPFCTGIAPGDTRITTRFTSTDFIGALLGTLHEVGHALYEQGLPKAAAYGTALAEAASLGVHESQSRLWENQVGRGRAFWTFFWPRVRDAIGPAFDGVGIEEWRFVLNAIQPSFIRTEADELTYDLHIALRFDLEHAMINGQLSVADLPAAWNARMKSDFGLDVPDAAMGCLQDVHWSAGLIGYFPTYTLGNLYAAQLFESVNHARPRLQDELSRGDFGGLLAWLREHIHRHGRRYRPRELCERATGQPRSADALIRRLTRKVADSYGA
ncbi:MAG TPA: carboxypeptidase M32 [Tepidisphaeraceae bacterium]